MEFFKKKNYIIFLIIIVFLNQHKVFAKERKTLYKRENISNYFLGTVSAKKKLDNQSYKYLTKVQILKNNHSKFNIEYLRSLVLVERFDEAFKFAKSIPNKDDPFYDVDLLLGLDFFEKEDYENAEKHFRRLNNISRQNIHFENFVGNILIAWIKASQGKKEESFKYLSKIPKTYRHITKTQSTFIKCFFDSNDTQNSFESLIQNKDYNFSRYNFFFANYLLYENKNSDAEKIIKESRVKYNSNLLLKETENFLLKKNKKKIKSYFNCKNPNDAIAEFFYIIANLYSTDNSFQLSNFYLKISLFLNSKFLTNYALLAENFFYQQQYKKSKKTYESLKSIGPVYSWHASRNIAQILIKEKGKEYAIKNLEKKFELLTKPSFEHYYDLANFYKNNEYYKKSIKYYSLALKNSNNNDDLIPKIFYRRGASYERLGEWKKAEKDLSESIKIKPEEAHVLNYLAYSWIDQGINLDKALQMVKKANSLQKEDGYIIDSLGWVYYAKKNYIEAEKFLQKAVELMPLDPTINDHYADTLWQLNKNIQARYIWSNVLKLEDVDEKLKNNINKKLLFGITEKL